MTRQSKLAWLKSDLRIRIRIRVFLRDGSGSQFFLSGVGSESDIFHDGRFRIRLSSLLEGRIQIRHPVLIYPDNILRKKGELCSVEISSDPDPNLFFERLLPILFFLTDPDPDQLQPDPQAWLK